MINVTPVKTIDSIVEDAIENAKHDAKYRMQGLADAIAMQPRQAVLPPLVHEWIEIDQLTEQHIGAVHFSSKHAAPMIVVTLGPKGRFEHTASFIRRLEMQYGDVTKTIDFPQASSREYLFGAIIEHEGTWRQTVKCNLTLDVQFSQSEFCRVIKEEVGQETVTKYETRIECDPAPGTVIEGV